MKRLAPAFIALAVVAAACTTAAGSSTTTNPEPITAPSQTGSASIPSSTTISVNDRVVETVGCADAPEEVSIVCEAYDLISRNYVDEISDVMLAEFASIGISDLDGSISQDELVCALPASAFTETCHALADQAEDSVEGAEAIVRGMAAALDPNSVYLDEESVALIEEEQEGQIEGIGALVTAEDSAITEGNPQCSIISNTCRLIIVSTVAGSPAEEAEILRDDVIMGVDGQDIEGWTLDEVTASVRGPAGTDVILTVARADGTFDVTITRAAVVIPVVDSANYDGIGYVKLNLFTEKADDQLQTALLNLLESGIDELVLDLRDNPGGLLDTAIEVTSLFLPDGDVVITQGPNNDRAFEVSGDPVVPGDIPMVTIINKGSASASEVVSAVLQERGRSTVIGENSFGKNTVQQRFSLSNGGAFKITIARWITPGGLDFGGDGVTPDLVRTLSPDFDAEAVAKLAAASN